MTKQFSSFVGTSFNMLIQIIIYDIILYANLLAKINSIHYISLLILRPSVPTIWGLPPLYYTSTGLCPHLSFRDSWGGSSYICVIFYSVYPSLFQSSSPCLSFYIFISIATFTAFVSPLLITLPNLLNLFSLISPTTGATPTLPLVN